MKYSKILTIWFIFIVILFFLPIFPVISNAMEDLHPISITIYWILLTLISITLSMRSLKGVER